ALVALKRVIKELGDLSSANNNKMRQAWDLYWIEHLVGDLHQPLHCTSNYESDSHGDAGGNTFKLLGNPKNLHALWDGGIDRPADTLSSGDIEAVTKDWTSPVLSPELQPAAADVDNLDIMSWIVKGSQLADSIVYKEIQKNKHPSDAYLQKEEALCARQAVLAGYRLAAILNQIFGA